jgi:hypothetical protein
MCPIGRVHVADATCTGASGHNSVCREGSRALFRPIPTPPHYNIMKYAVSPPAVLRLARQLRALNMNDATIAELTTEPLHKAVAVLAALEDCPMSVDTFATLRQDADDALALHRHTFPATPPRSTIQPVQRAPIKFVPKVVAAQPVQLIGILREVNRHKEAVAESTAQRCYDAFKLREIAASTKVVACQAITKNGAPCKLHSHAGDSIPLCSTHRKQLMLAEAAAHADAAVFVDNLEHLAGEAVMPPPWEVCAPTYTPTLAPTTAPTVAPTLHPFCTIGALLLHSGSTIVALWLHCVLHCVWHCVLHCVWHCVWHCCCGTVCVLCVLHCVALLIFARHPLAAARAVRRCSRRHGRRRRRWLVGVLRAGRWRWRPRPLTLAPAD